MSAPSLPSALPASASNSPSPSDSEASGSGGSGGGGTKSSYYFFKSTPAHEAQKYMPTLLTPASASASASAAASTAAASPSPVSSPSPEQSPDSSTVSASGPSGSHWNAAGTWEEKDLSSWAATRLTQLLSFSHAGLNVSCTKVTGDATLVFTRGKKRVGYDLAIVCEWTGQAEAEAEAEAGGSGAGELVKGGLELPSVDQTSVDDFELVVTVKERGKAGDEAVDRLTRAAKKLRDPLTGKMRQFEKELQES